eukprot:TRINITY_DN10716_c0_g2_i1.p1 TRINITY_DN10716_c0_g2~~TRINITY_DN10716_c0_g2_i1.p1  ORF type:complete len:1313 (+),score=400.41 TRINITY_DN10716_c0_g2_i1:120-4058(+)
MNNYQIYEEIGRGKHSTVYKGRRKKTIEYFAIKSVEKSQRTRVLNEVTMLHRLDHPNVLQFHHWYETSNHLWLIVEYCTGADVLSLIKQDTSLPEDTLKAFATDIVHALGYIHSKGIIFCDLKPSNMLVDAHGFLKLADFGLACLVDEVTPDKRRIGTPSYMAPELFQEGGVPSLATDLWSLGCVLYEIFVGHPPFTDQKVDTLIQKVVYDDFTRPQGASREFTELLEGLLEKDPLDRVDWPELLEMEFWGEREMPKALSLPAQPSFEKYKARRKAEGAGSRREARERRRKEVARVAAAAQQNLVRERAGATYNDQRDAANGLDTNAEVDFREHDEEEAAQEEEEQHGLHAVDEAAGAGGEVVHAALRVASASVPTRKDGGGEGGDGGGGGGGGGAAKPADATEDVYVSTVLFHASDSQVKPIMCNTRIEKIPEAKFDAASLPFPTHSFEQVCSMKNAELEAFLTQIYKSIGGHTTIGDKYNSLCYFEILCTDTQTANLFINSSLMLLFIKMVQNENYPANLKARLCMVMGLLIRHATYIGSELAQTGIVHHLLKLVDDKSVRVRRRAVACVGELLFYVATQSPADRQPWDIKPAVAVKFHAALNSDDEAVRHYCVRTLENIAGHNDVSYSRNFPSRGAASALAECFIPGERQAKNEHLRASAASTLSRLCRAYHPCLLWVLSDIGVQGLATQIQQAGHNRTLQASLNILNLLLCKTCLWLQNGSSRPRDEDALFASLSPPRSADPQQQSSLGGMEPDDVFGTETLSADHCMRLMAEVQDNAQTIVHGLMASLEHSLAVIRGKALLCIHLLTVCDLQYIAMCCDCKLFSLLERVGKDRDPYMKSCFKSFCNMLVAAVSLIVHRLSAQLRQHRHAAATEYLPVAVHSLTNSAVRGAAVSASVVEGLAWCLSAAEEASRAQPQGGDSATQQCLLMAEALAQDSAAVSRHHRAITKHLLPVLAALLSADNGDTRFLSLKIFIDVLAQYFANTDVYPAKADEAATADLDNILLTQLFPRIAALLEDEEPIPLYGLKLLNNIASKRQEFFVPRLAEASELVPKLFKFFELEHRNNNVHNVKLILKVVACDAIPYQLVFNLGIVRKLTGVLAYAFQNSVETFFEPCLDICHTLLYRTMQLGQRWAESRKKDTAVGEEYEERRQHCQPLTNDLELYATLAASSDAAETAAHCLLLCTQLYPSTRIHDTIVGERVRGHLRACLAEQPDDRREERADCPLSSSAAVVCRCVLRTLLTVLRAHPPPPQGPDYAGQLRRDDLLIIGVRSVASAAAPRHAQREADGTPGELAALAQQFIDLVYV